MMREKLNLLIQLTNVLNEEMLEKALQRLSGKTVWEAELHELQDLFDIMRERLNYFCRNEIITEENEDQYPQMLAEAVYEVIERRVAQRTTEDNIDVADIQSTTGTVMEMVLDRCNNNIPAAKAMMARYLGSFDNETQVIQEVIHGYDFPEFILEMIFEVPDKQKVMAFLSSEYDLLYHDNMISVFRYAS
ncbi:MAG: hypothetical protein AAF639_16285 [Chloroflexota bacterium]